MSGEPYVYFLGPPTCRFKTYGSQTQIWVSSPPQSDIGLGGELVLICISTRNANGKKFLHRKVHEIICSSEVKTIFQTSSHACEFEKFSVRFFPFFEYFRPI